MMNKRLCYCKPAEKFEEALVIGNGKTGATVYSQPGEEHISLNDDTLWSGNGQKNKIPKNAPLFYKKARELVLEGKSSEAEKLICDNFLSDDCQLYMPLGDLYINFGNSSYSGYSRSLDMETGIVYSEYTTGKAVFKRESFVSFPDKIAVFKISSDSKALNFSLHLSTQLKLIEICCENGVMSLCGVAPPDGRDYNSEAENYRYSCDGNNGLKFSISLKVCTDGAVNFNNGHISVSEANNAVIYLATETEYESLILKKDSDFRKMTAETVAKLELSDYSEIRKRHISDFSELFNRVNLKLTDKASISDTYERLKAFDGSDLGLYELLFNYGRYLSIASSRSGTEVTNLQGIWNEKLLPPWSCCIVLNINAEMNYWHMLNTNLAECFEPFICLAEKLHKNGQATAKEYYNAKGFVVHHNTDIWGMTNPVGKGVGSFAIRYAFWTMSTSWIACQLFSAYEYTLDKKLLERVFPIIYDAALFFADTVYEDENGSLFVSPTTSPENTYIYKGRETAIAKTSAMSQTILKELFSNTIKAAEILEKNDGLIERLREILPKIKALSLNKDGTLAEWCGDETESDIHHRHVSHLYGLFPGNSINPEVSPELAEACRKTLLKRGDNGTGWSLAWKICLWAHLNDGEHALKLLKRQLSLVEPTEEINYSDKGGTFPNLLDAHPPFQIDGNFGSTAAICNMLMQSRIGEIKLLPALPKQWPDGEVCGIVAKGNVTIDMKWKNGKVSYLSLLSPISQSVSVNCNNVTQSVTLQANQKLILISDII